MDAAAGEACGHATYTASVMTHHLCALLGVYRAPRQFSRTRAELPRSSLSASSTRRLVSPSAIQRSKLESVLLLFHLEDISNK